MAAALVVEDDEQLAYILRFILNNLDVHTTIPGMRKPKHVASNLAASDQGPLPAQLHAQLRPHRWVRTPTKWSQ